MAEHKRPEQRSASSGAGTTDRAKPQPTGGETYKASARAAGRQERETDEAWEGATPTQFASEEEKHLSDSIAHLQQVATEYFNRMGETAGELTQQARKVYETSRGYLGDNPAPTVGGAFLLGMLLGYLLDRD